ncbi:AAA family ATPase [Krasilnikovia sp. MM14-A1259]
MVVLFLDLVGWTGLGEDVDPEPLQLLLEQYYELSSAAVEEHGGTVEKFIGDAVMAVFGADRSGEDDAVRALRAAARIRAEVGGLARPGTGTQALRIHCGVAAGEALVTRSSRAGLRVVGDVVNVAARLQSAAAAGEILVNDVAGDLAAAHWTLQPLTPLPLKGKAEPVTALRVIGPAATGRAADSSPMVDREAERGRLIAAYRSVQCDRRGRTVVVLGPPGIGKSRLVRAAVGEFRPQPVAVVGACPSYAPPENAVALTEVLDALTGRAGPARDLVRADARIAAALAALRGAGRGARDDPGPGPGVEEVSWAARELLTAAASAGPVVVVWDGLQWSGPSLLRLVGELAESVRDLPVLTICVARPEPAGRAAWLRALPRCDVLDVGALGPADSAELAGLLVAAAPAAEVQAHGLDLVERVTRHSAGNPLFIRLMVESGRPATEVPPTITAMVGAMIDRLPAAARRLLGAASVIGSTFTLDQVAALGEPVPGEAVETLSAGGLIRASARPGEFCFVQQPVHEVAYGRLDKQRRLDRHRRLAEAGLSPGFHGEAAVRLLRELRPGDPELVTLSRRAGRALLAEGTAALRQRDLPAATGLLHRALSLAVAGADRGTDLDEAGDDAAVAAIRLSDALLLAGDTRRAATVVADIIGNGDADGLDRPACLVQQHLLAVRAGRPAAVPPDRIRRGLAAVAGDRLARCRMAQLRMLIHLGRGRFAAAQRAALVALAHARTLGDEYEQDRLLVALCEIRQWSPTPLAEQLAGGAELARRFAADRFLLVPVLAARARCLALIGDEAGARAALAQAREAVEQLQLTMGGVLIDQAAGLVCALSGDHTAAERHFRRAAGVLDRADHGPGALTLRVQAARERAGRDPAGAAAEVAALLARGSEMDVRGLLLCLSASIRLDVGGPDLPDPRLDEVTALLARTDDPCLRGDVHADLAHACAGRGDRAAARASADAAIGCYAQVGATAPMEAVTACR